MDAWIGAVEALRDRSVEQLVRDRFVQKRKSRLIAAADG
jgi:hypothetical protein